MGSYLIRGAHLLTLGGDRGELVTGDLRIDGQHISRSAPALSSNGAELIDATGMIAMPGLIDSHRPCWGSILRDGACYGDLSAYFATKVLSRVSIPSSSAQGGRETAGGSLILDPANPARDAPVLRDFLHRGYRRSLLRYLL